MFFYGNFFFFLGILDLLSFLWRKLLINFSSVSFQTMSLKRTIRYSIFFYRLLLVVAFLNLNLAYKNITRSHMDTGLKLGAHGCLLNTSCTLNLHTVTTGNCHQFYYKTSITEVLQFNNFYGEMAGITYMKIDLNYTKYISNKSISQNLQSIRNKENSIKYYRISIAMSLLFLYENSTTEG